MKVHSGSKTASLSSIDRSSPIPPYANFTLDLLPGRLLEMGSSLRTAPDPAAALCPSEPDPSPSEHLSPPWQAFQLQGTAPIPPLPSLS